MKRHPPVFMMVFLLFAVGCASTAPHSTDTKETGPDSARASIYVNGDRKGLTPASLRIKRSFGETKITLRQGEQTVRRFKTERVPTSNSAELLYRSGAPRIGRRSYRVDELPTQDDSTYVIPYFRRPIVVEDPRYKLDLVVEN